MQGFDNGNNMKFYSNFQYRNYLTKNGTNIINTNNYNHSSNQQCKCNYENIPTPLTTNSPFLYSGITDDKRPHGYTESDLKTNYINRRLKKYALDDFRIMNAVEYIYNIPYDQFTTNAENQ